MNILIVQAAKLGDMVCTTPMFRAVKQTYPNARLFVMGSALNKEVVAGNPHIDEYLVEPKDARSLRAILREKNIDAAVCTSPYPAMLQALLFARVRKIVVPKIVGGFSPYATKTYRLLSLFATKVLVRFGEYMPRQYLKLLEPLGIHNNDTTKELVFSAAARERVKELLPEVGFLVGIAPGVGNGIKKWGGERFAEVATELSKRHKATIVLFGGEADISEVTSMRAALPQDIKIIDLSNTLSIEELKASIARLDLFISVDTGPVYIAEALNVATVDIVGPMDEREQPPRGERHVVVVPPHRVAPALHILNAAMYDKNEALRQAESITPTMVIEAAEALIKKIR